jgi:hypothetical protein
MQADQVQDRPPTGVGQDLYVVAPWRTDAAHVIHEHGSPEFDPHRLELETPAARKPDMRAHRVRTDVRHAHADRKHVHGFFFPADARAAPSTRASASQSWMV